MPQKPIKRGYMVWIWADKTGYVCQFQIYTEKIGGHLEKDLGARVLTDLTRTFVGKEYNFFILLAFRNKFKLIYSCGTLKRTRMDLPGDTKGDNVMQKGDSDCRISKDGVTYVKWKDRKAVHFLSNHLEPTEVSQVKRKQKDGSLKNINCPTVVVNYNRHMGYVDKMDMLKNIYEINQKFKKWWRRIFWYFVDVTIVNSYCYSNMETWVQKCHP